LSALPGHRRSWLVVSLSADLRDPDGTVRRSLARLSRIVLGASVRGLGRRLLCAVGGRHGACVACLGKGARRPLGYRTCRRPERLVGAADSTDPAARTL